MGAPAKPGFWQTLPGVLTAVAAVMTAVTGVIVGLTQAGIIGGGDGGVKAPTQDGTLRYTTGYDPAIDATLRKARA